MKKMILNYQNHPETEVEIEALKDKAGLETDDMIQDHLHRPGVQVELGVLNDKTGHVIHITEIGVSIQDLPDDGTVPEVNHVIIIIKMINGRITDQTKAKPTQSVGIAIERDTCSVIAGS